MIHNPSVIQQLQASEDLQSYDQWVRAHPHGSLWQSLAWKRYQEALGRETRVYAALDGGEIRASALVVIDRTTMRLSTWDIPRGPLGMKNEEGRRAKFLENIVEEAKQDRCFALYLSPQESIRHSSFATRHSTRHQYPEATRIIDLTKSEEEMLAQMKPKGRYNISVAQKHGVAVSCSEDVAAFYELLRGTGARDAFDILPRSHYEAFLRHLEGSFLLLAQDKTGTPIAGLLGVIWGQGGIYYYGASSYAARALMAPYALQWRALRHCKAQGCTQYDLLGVSPPETGAGHPWQGVSAFKEKFGGTVALYPPEQELTLRPFVATLLRWKRRMF